MAQAGGVPHFAQRLGFDLADAFARHVVLPANFLQGPFIAVHQAETHFDNLALALGQGGQDIAQSVLEQTVTVTNHAQASSNMT